MSSTGGSSSNNNNRNGTGTGKQPSSPAGSRPNSRQQQQQQNMPPSSSPSAHRHRQSQHNKNRARNQQLTASSSPRSERIGRKVYGGSVYGGTSNSSKHSQWLDLPMTHPHHQLDNHNSSNHSSSSPPHRSQSFRHRARPDGLLLVSAGGARRTAAAAGSAVAANGGPFGLQQQQNGNGELADSTPERRRSTPTIHRRASVGRSSRAAMLMEPRIDVWPERKPMSEAEERFLQLPDQADYTRVRQFNIDAKGAVISRGDSFRRKRQQQAATAAPIASNGAGFGGQQQQAMLPDLADQQQQKPVVEEMQQQPLERSSTGSSMKSSVSVAFAENGSENGMAPPPSASPGFPFPNGNADADAPSCSYKICVLGQPAAGKSSLIGRFMSSSNAFSDADDDLLLGLDGNDLQQQQPTAHAAGGCADAAVVSAPLPNCCVSVNIGGHECDLQFAELDLPLPAGQEDQFLAAQMKNFHVFLLVYSIDRKQSFRLALRTLELFRAHHCPAPVILVGNKADLERRRVVMEPEVRSAMLTYDVPHFEVSVALDHDVDDLLVGIVAQVKEAFRMNIVSPNGVELGQKQSTNSKRSGSSGSTNNSEDFHAAIRRFSQRKKRQMGVSEMGLESSKCMNLFEKLRKWRKGTSNC